MSTVTPSPIIIDQESGDYEAEMTITYSNRAAFESGEIESVSVNLVDRQGPPGFPLAYEIWEWDISSDADIIHDPRWVACSEPRAAAVDEDGPWYADFYWDFTDPPGKGSRYSILNFGELRRLIAACEAGPVIIDSAAENVRGVGRST